jgi:hypothetical protein
LEAIASKLPLSAVVHGTGERVNPGLR